MTVVCYRGMISACCARSTPTWAIRHRLLDRQWPGTAAVYGQPRDGITITALDATLHRTTYGNASKKRRNPLSAWR